MKPVASLFYLVVIITFILIAGSSGKHAKHSLAALSDTDSEIPYPFLGVEPSYHRLNGKYFPPIRHHRSAHQERIFCEESSQCGGDEPSSTKLDSKTASPRPTVEPTTHHRSPSTTDFALQGSERARGRQASKGTTMKALRKTDHKGKKDTWRKHGSKNRESSLEQNEFLNRPQSDASNNTSVHDAPEGILGADPQSSTAKSPGSPHPSDSTSSTGCVDKLENITMCVKDISTTTPSTVPSVLPVTVFRSETIIVNNNYTETVPSTEADPELQFKQNHAYIFEHFCKNPIPELISVSSYYSDGRTYSPALTVLHRCRSPCCDMDDTCKPQTTQNVNFYFKVSTYSVSGTRRKSSSYEKLYFINHTSCTCDSKNMMSMGISDINEVQRDAPAEEANYEDRAIEEEAEEEVEEVEEEREKEMKVKTEEYEKGCGCALPFVENPEDGPCRCDCNKGDSHCLRFKLGISYIHRGWWRCIKARKCTPPECQYGDFLIQFGRCPKKKEYLNQL